VRRIFRRRRLLVPLAFATLAFVPAATAAGTVRITSVDLSGYPRIAATVLAPAGSRAPVLTQNGNQAPGVQAVNLGQEKAIVLALDRSQSMRGRPLAEAVRAAQTFTHAAGTNDHVGVVAFGRDATALTSFGMSPVGARDALAGITTDSRSGTALYDAVVLAAQRLQFDDRPGRAVVVVTDGQDVSSSHSLADAVNAAHAAHAAVYTIGIAGPSFTSSALRQLARDTGGSYRQSSAGDLSAVYAALAHELARTWEISYPTALRPGASLLLRASVAGTGAAQLQTVVPGAPPATVPASSLIPSLGYSPAGTLAVGAACFVLVLLACCFWFASRGGNRVRRRIEPHLASREQVTKTRRKAAPTAARREVVHLFEHVLGDLRQFKSLQVTIERADLPLRAGELVAICSGAALVGAFLTAVIAQSALLVPVVMAVLGGLPYAYVSLRAAGRVKQFENQLPDLLITIAASLKAGHSFRQSIQSVVEEGSEPAAKEFRRVLTETQLGKPMDEALTDLAERVGSENLTFVVNAVTIQRQVGGSLAGLFDMVADTVRQRQQFLRKVKGLTAMGRMSAYVLVGLPFFIATVVTLMNPLYMSPLWHTSSGNWMLAIGLAMIAIGSSMLKKLVSFKG
jgi:tight adherence protein B